MAAPEVDGMLLSFTEVRMSPDLKHAMVWWRRLRHAIQGAVVENCEPQCSLARKDHARAPPDARHAGPEIPADTRFEDDARIDELLKSPEVARDLGPEKEEG